MEKWMEMDLYWFQSKDQDARISQLFARIEPLLKDNSKERMGLSLCIGWLFDAVLYWNKNPNQVIATCQEPTYWQWTYRDLNALLRKIRIYAQNKGIQDFHLSISLLGGETMAYDADNTCEGWSGRTQEVKERAHYNIHGSWFYEHSEINKDKYGIFDYNGIVQLNDDAHFGKDKVTFGEFFAVKLTDFCKYVGLDAVVLRDGVFAPSYIRGGKTRYKETALREEITGMLIHTLKRMKELYPNFLVIGYDSGTSAIEQFRAHGFDLEAVAMAGCLDLWITQTWASAWQDYWPANSMGYTFQLQNFLAEAAMLTNTPCKHMFLIETFDAWEPWDSIHMYPDKVQWEIFAYSHACVIQSEKKRKYADGCYISWMNKKENLLPEETVSLLADVLQKVEKDLCKKPIPIGPCIIYGRHGILKSMKKEGSVSRGEEFDDWCAMLEKYGLPILSVTRSEWLEQTNQKFYICPSVCTGDIEQIILDKSRNGADFLFLGCAAQISPSIKQALSIVTKEYSEQNRICYGKLSQELEEFVDTSAVAINQKNQTLLPNEQWTSHIKCENGVIFAEHRTLPFFIWETPEWGTPYELHLTNKSIQSPQLYAAVSRKLAEKMNFRWRNSDWQKPVCFVGWKYESGEVCVLLANLETGVTGNSQFACKGQLDVPCKYQEFGETEYPLGKLYGFENGTASIAIAPHKLSLIRIREVKNAAER